jgi:hypothetical protein
MAQEAVDCCAQLNEWALCVRVAQDHGISVENLLNSRMAKFKTHGRKADLVNLYKSAAQHHMSALALADLAKDAAVCKISFILSHDGTSSHDLCICLAYLAIAVGAPEEGETAGLVQADQASPVRIKQLYVLAALEVEKARNLNERELVQSHGLTVLGGGFAAGATTMMTLAQHTLQGLVTQDLAEGRVRTCILSP